MTYHEEASNCNHRVWVGSLLVSSVFSCALGFVIFGLSLGTIKSPVFVYHVWSFLEPVYKVACADIACGVFICVAGALGCCVVAYRHPLFSRIYSILLVLLFTFQLAIGIATIIISDEKTEFLRAITVTLCVNPVLSRTFLGDNEGYEIDGAARENVVRLTETLMSEAGPLDRLFAQQALPPLTLEECNYFVNLSTPCGSLLICGAVLYMYMLYCVINLRDYYKRHEPKNWLKDWQAGNHQKGHNTPVASHFVPTLGSVEKATVEIHS